ncbi:flagellar biosynthetic protein FliO [Marinomonas sp. C2222]|uniref:Flagellar protein n=1 Tax=Marinomonas sargassi TaxID=2984494 RepID=A0ABT2YNC5_9GAMM|nr:flagellar biosynthetic protein FliO [Marinomonas sargassi]MCV2401385.1 flagellar biosynthetic protein FliO [Marinomonas sargassi]
MTFHRLLSFILAVISVMAASLLYAVDYQTSPTPTFSIWKIVLSLVFIVVFIPACLWLVKRFQLAQMKLGQSDIKVLNVQSLGTKEKLMLVEVEGEKILIGVTPHNITHLKDIPSQKKSFASVLEDVDIEGQESSECTSILQEAKK